MYSWHDVLDSGDIKVSIFQRTPVTSHEALAMRCTPDSTMLTQQGLRHNARDSAEIKMLLLGHRCHSYYPCLSGWFPAFIQRQHINSGRCFQGPIDRYLCELQ